MRVNLIARLLLSFFYIQVWGLAVSASSILAQQPPHCAQILYCLFNQEAGASGSAAVHKYSEDLIELIVSNPSGQDAFRRLSDQLSDRLTNAEQTARTGNGKLVPESAVVKAFNDLMQGIGAPSSMRASETAMRAFRQHATSIKAFPALFTEDRNGANCYPGEAAFLFYLLISNNGELSQQELDRSVSLMHMNTQATENSFGFAGMEPMGSNVSSLLSSYSSRHNHNATIALFNRAAGILGF